MGSTDAANLIRDGRGGPRRALTAREQEGRIPTLRNRQVLRDDVAVDRTQRLEGRDYRSVAMALDRFMEAQDSNGAYACALAELRAGTKQTHWMWFVFPQLAGLGRSERAARYALADLDEARQYEGHAVLGTRLRESCDAVAALDTRAPIDIFGEVDSLKFRSSLTLFARAVPAEPRFQQLLDKYFEGFADRETDRLLRKAAGTDD